MKQKVIYFILLLLSVGIISCADGPLNTLTFTNLAAGDVIVNFKGSETEVASGATVELTDILQGEYEYETIYELPAGTTSSSASENLAGTFVLNAGTEILVIYTSVFQDGNYSISASITSSDNLLEDGILPNPISP